MSTYMIDRGGVVQFLRLSQPQPQYQFSDRERLERTHCPNCGVTLAKGKLPNHLVIAHGANSWAAMQAASPWARTDEPSHAGDSTGRRSTADASLQDHSGGGDTRDAGRHFCHFARERGRFGSMPKYDDYGDEGTAA